MTKNLHRHIQSFFMKLVHYCMCQKCTLNISEYKSAERLNQPGSLFNNVSCIDDVLRPGLRNICDSMGLMIKKVVKRKHQRDISVDVAVVQSEYCRGWWSIKGC